MVLLNAKALTPEEATAKIATIQQIIMAINALSKVTFFNNLSLGSNVFFSPLHFFHSSSSFFFLNKKQVHLFHSSVIDFFFQNVILVLLVSVISL